MDQQKEKEKDDKKPGVPTLRDTAQKPQLKIKGLKAGQSILERLKQFKKKDLAFILAGLGVLFMAPLAEHFLMSPDNGEGAFKEGWNVKPGAGGLGSGGSPFEPGAGGVAPGDLAGGGSDVITPLNVRDPSALIMGPGATQQPPATTSSAGGAPAKESSDWKDALSQSAAHAASAATHAATPLPPLPQLSGGGLRGLGSVSGGGGASYSLPPISAGGVPNHGGGGGSLGLAKAAPGYQGAAARSLTSSGGLDQLKSRAGQAGDSFNRAGGAGSGLQNAAATNMGSGSDFGGAGEGGQGMGQDKAGGQSQNKDSKSEGESLAFLAAKENQEKAIDLKWKLIEKKAMLWPDLRQKMVEEMMMTPLKKFTDKFADSLGDFISGKGSTYSCFRLPDGKTSVADLKASDLGSVSTIKKDDTADNCNHGHDKDSPGYTPAGDKMYKTCSEPFVYYYCPGSKDGGGPKQDSGPDAPGLVGGVGSGFTGEMHKMCDAIQTEMNNKGWDTRGDIIKDPNNPAKANPTLDSYNAARKRLGALIAANDALTGSGGVSECAGWPIVDQRGGKDYVANTLDMAAGELATNPDSVLQAMVQATNQLHDVTQKAIVAQADAKHDALAKALGALDGKLKTQPVVPTEAEAARTAASNAYTPAQAPLDQALTTYNGDDTKKALAKVKDVALDNKLKDVQTKLDATSAEGSGMLATVNKILDDDGGVTDVPGGGSFKAAIANQTTKIQGVATRLGNYWHAIDDVKKVVNGDGSGQGTGQNGSPASLASVRALCNDADTKMQNGLTALRDFDKNGPGTLAKSAPVTDPTSAAALDQVVAGQISQLGDGKSDPNAKTATLWAGAIGPTKDVDSRSDAANTAIKGQVNTVSRAKNTVGSRLPDTGSMASN